MGMPTMFAPPFSGTSRSPRRLVSGLFPALPLVDSRSDTKRIRHSEREFASADDCTPIAGAGVSVTRGTTGISLRPPIRLRWGQGSHPIGSPFHIASTFRFAGLEQIPFDFHSKPGSDDLLAP